MKDEYGHTMYSEKLLDITFDNGHAQRVSNQFANGFGDYLDDWNDTMQMMIDRGARGTDQQFDDILDYLHRTQSTINVNYADAHELQIVLNVSAMVAQAIIARREASPFKGLDDLKSVAGLDTESLNTRSRLIFF
jgi:competence protein ComEA